MSGASSGFRLVVTEKPSVARDIARVLGAGTRAHGFFEGRNLLVTWCLGHLVELAEPAAYHGSWRRWSMEQLPFLPREFKLKVRDSAKDQWEVVRRLLQHERLEGVVNACDAGREGELIFAHVYQHAACAAPVQRLWISSLTDGSIRAGFRALKPGQQLKPLEDAARCRVEADWLVGLNATRAMTLRVRRPGERAVYSLGRVQTPTLAIMVEREDAIDRFEARAFWQVKARFQTEKGAWDAFWTRQGDKSKDKERFFHKNEAQQVLDRLQGEHGVLTRVERRRTREPAPLLYDLTTLQRAANKRYAYSAARTLELAQALYEKHKVLTYPRTDSRHLSGQQVPGLKALVESLAFGPYEGVASQIVLGWPVELGSRVVDDAEVTDHHAIVPTGANPLDKGLDLHEKRIFDLVARRFLAVFLPPAVFARVLLETTVGHDIFLARGRSRLEAGWQQIDPPRKLRKDRLLPAVDRGQRAQVLDMGLKQGRTKPPPHHSEASLLGAMERAGEGMEDVELKRALKQKGLGTPATRAAIIETLIGRGFVRRESSHMLPTPRGRTLLKLLPVSPLRSARLTGEWEARLSQVEAGREDRERFMADIRQFTGQVVETLKAVQLDPLLLADLLPRIGGAQQAAVGTCPRCSQGVFQTPEGWRCSACELFIPARVARRTVSRRMATQLLERGATKVLKGFRARSGKEFSAALKLDEHGAVGFHFPEPEALGTCPSCGKPVRSRGSVFTCDTGRDCPFVVFQEMSGLKITRRMVEDLLRDGQGPEVEGFVELRSRRSFHGRLEWNGRRVIVVPRDPRHEAGQVGICPLCGSGVLFQGSAWRCMSCRFHIAGKMAGRDLQAVEVGALLKDGRTRRLYGFRKRGGSVFKAALVLESDGGLSFDFKKDPNEQDRPPLPGQPPYAFGKRVDCPVCLSGASTEPGYVIEGRAAWGCSRWREGCPFRVPFVVQGKKLPPEQAMRLFGKQRATKIIKGFHGPGGGRFTGRVVLEPGSEPCWKVKPKT